jgi:SAM-dependent methyltransferase
VDFNNLMFVAGEVAQSPWQPNFFSHVISVESSYYWPDPAAGIKDIFRVLGDGGSAWILINYYRDNPHCHQWGSLLAVPTHLFAAEEWAEHLRTAGFTNVAHERIVDRAPSPEVYTGRWFRDAEQLAAFKSEGALLVWGIK